MFNLIQGIFWDFISTLLIFLFFPWDFSPRSSWSVWSANARRVSWKCLTFAEAWRTWNGRLNAARTTCSWKRSFVNYVRKLKPMLVSWVNFVIIKVRRLSWNIAMISWVNSWMPYKKKCKGCRVITMMKWNNWRRRLRSLKMIAGLIDKQWKSMWKSRLVNCARRR